MLLRFPVEQRAAEGETEASRCLSVTVITRETACSSSDEETGVVGVGAVKEELDADDTLRLVPRHVDPPA